MHSNIHKPAVRLHLQGVILCSQAEWALAVPTGAVPEYVLDVELVANARKLEVWTTE